MGFIKLPETVNNITHNTLLAAKNIEVTDLETHVLVCSLRHDAVDDRISRLENKVNEIILHAEATNKLIVRTLVAMAGSVVTSLIITHFKIL